MPQIAPKPSESESSISAEAYDRWLREKVARSLADPRPSVQHDDAVAAMRLVLDSADRSGGDR
ncbi:type II toxin-antitoxin system RelB family antitoxin [Sphingomonas sp. LB3N6]|uniref:type II toxin-antitoxin system RelB family antitoxin n=1 Tax=Sphingomonas fucosidasi TaxID=3096164 RepID=UPI002FC747D6